MIFDISNFASKAHIARLIEYFFRKKKVACTIRYVDTNKLFVEIYFFNKERNN